MAENPLLDGNPEIAGDLYQAIEICSRPDDFAFDHRKSSWLRRWFWELRTAKMDKDLEVIKFMCYLEDYTTGPKVWSSAEGGGKGAKCHWTVSSVAALMKHLGFSRAEAWSLSPGEASWMLVAAFEADPWITIDVQSEDEVKAIAALQAMDEDELLTTPQGKSNGDSD